jgi:hypothetical protein
LNGLDIEITDPEASGWHSLMVRRSIIVGEMAFHRRYTPTLVPLATWPRWPGDGGRWRNPFRAGKGTRRARRAAGPPLDHMTA